MEAVYARMLDELKAVEHKLTAWEKDFVDKTRDRRIITIKVGRKITQIYEERIEGKVDPDRPRDPVDFGRVNARRSSEGWQVEIDGKPMGRKTSRPEISIVCQWLTSIINIPETEVAEDAPEDDRNPF